MGNTVVILGIFVADTTYRASHMPRMGETLIGDSFHLTPGGKGSNQAVASARTGADTHFITRLGDDDFARMAGGIWSDAGVTPHITYDADSYTGAASVFIESATGNNAIIVCPGAARQMTSEDCERHRKLIEEAGVFITQLEQPVDVAYEALKMAHQAGVKTILNPAPAALLPDDMLTFCDFVTPNESEAELLTGVAVHSVQDAENAARILREKGAAAVLITLGEMGALYQDDQDSIHIPAINAGPVAETTGAGDAFNGGFAAALASGMSAFDAALFGTATAAISVTRAGTAASMPDKQEVMQLIAEQSNQLS